MSTFLDDRASFSQQRVEVARRGRPLPDLLAHCATLPMPPRLDTAGFLVIAEVKLRSPSEGRLAAPETTSRDLVHRAKVYGEAGADAISVLTEPERFDGHLEHLAEVSRAVRTPCMRKDFLVDAYQVWEARAAGASGVLLITTMVDDPTLAELLDACEQAGLFALVECFDATDVARTGRQLAGRGLTALVGVNTRDLRTLEVRADRLESLVDQLPAGWPWIAESGLVTPEDVARAAGLGYQGVLVGTALMRAEDPAATLRAFRAAANR